MRCDRVADVLPGLVDGADRLDPAGRDHVEHCLRCQADLARYRRLRRELLALRPGTAPVPADLLAELLAGLDIGDGRHRHVRRRAAYLGGIAAATAAGVGGVLVLAARGRRLAG